MSRPMQNRKRCIDKFGANVIQFVGKPAIKHRIIRRRELSKKGPIVVNRIKYEMQLQAKLPRNVQAIQMEFLSKHGHWDIVDTINWSP